MKSSIKRVIVLRKVKKRSDDGASDGKDRIEVPGTISKAFPRETNETDNNIRNVEDRKCKEEKI